MDDIKIGTGTPPYMRSIAATITNENSPYRDPTLENQATALHSNSGILFLVITDFNTSHAGAIIDHSMEITRPHQRLIDKTLIGAPVHAEVTPSLYTPVDARRSTIHHHQESYRVS
nr:MULTISPECIES: hypothetical protein [unclassified Corynebacterium]